MWFWLSLASAVLGAVDIILNKKALKNVSPVVLNWGINSLSIPVLLPFVLRAGFPATNPTFWLAVISSALTWAVGKSLINSGLKNSLTSQIIPLSSLSGVFLYIFGIIFLGENLKAASLSGLLLILVGSYILNADEAKEDLLKPFKLIFQNKIFIFYLLGLVIVGLTAILDKISLLNTSPVSILFVLFLEDMLECLILTSYLVVKEKKTWLREVKGNLLFLFINSLMLTLIGIVVFAAYSTNGPVALVLGIKRLQVFFVLVLGYLFLNDKPTKHTWIATAVMIAGTILIKIG